MRLAIGAHDAYAADVIAHDGDGLEGCAFDPSMEIKKAIVSIDPR